MFEGAPHNLPDSTAEQAAHEALSLVRRASDDDIILVLVSGGGSALLPCPPKGVPLQEKREAVEFLGKAGASIRELNAFRRCVSQTKGGRLAEAAYPTKVSLMAAALLTVHACLALLEPLVWQMLCLVLSDVIGDPLDVIASGTTVPNPTPPSQVLRVLDRFGRDGIAPSIIRHLEALEQAEAGGARAFPHVQNVVIGNSRTAIDTAAETAKRLGYTTCVWSSCVEGEARAVGELYAGLVRAMLGRDAMDVGRGVEELLEQECFRSVVPSLRADLSSLLALVRSGSVQRPCCLLSGGEPTVTVRGKGKGGRNQELALAFSLAAAGLQEQQTGQVLFASVATDGQDGPCDAGGAVVDLETIEQARQEGLHAEGFLEDNDSYTFFSKLDGGAHLVRFAGGLTGTNVMDLHFLLWF